jgi:hypothetical protein
MRLLFKFILLLILLSPVAVAALAWYGLSEQPRVLQGARLTHQDIAQARGILQHNDPRHLPAGARRQLHISQQNLNLAANYLLQRFGGVAAVVVETGVAYVDISTRIPRLPVRPYLNVSAEIHAVEGQPQLHGLRIGQVAVPDAVAGLLLGELVKHLGRSRGASLAMTSVQDLKLRPGRLSLLYEWQPELLEAVQADLMPAGQQQAMAAYYQHLAQLHAAGQGSRGSLSELLPAMFELASRRSLKNDPVMENRALLAVLGAWASRQGMDRLIPPAQRQGKLARFRIKLQGRTDFAQHFLTSAALAAHGDTLLSDAVGLYKEVSDSQGGSGFSFTDIAADRAGTRFGELAAASPSEARTLQKRLASGIGEADIMPAARDLPEHMSAAEFERRFGGVDSPAYRRIMAEIEDRIARLALYQPH